MLVKGQPRRLFACQPKVHDFFGFIVKGFYFRELLNPPDLAEPVSRAHGNIMTMSSVVRHGFQWPHGQPCPLINGRAGQ